MIGQAEPVTTGIYLLYYPTNYCPGFGVMICFRKSVRSCWISIGPTMRAFKRAPWRPMGKGMRTLYGYGGMILNMVPVIILPR